MADIKQIQFKRTKEAGKKPTLSQVAEGELAINLIDRSIFTSDGQQVIELSGQATNEATYMKKSANLSDVTDLTTSRVNLQVNRLVQLTNYTYFGAPSMRNDAGTGKALFIADSGVWGVTDLATGIRSALGITEGGTGSTTAAGARINLGIDALTTSATETVVQAPNKTTNLYVKNNGDWGVYSTTLGTDIALRIGAGGTGGKTKEEAQVNLDVPSNAQAFLKKDNLEGIDRSAGWLNLRPQGSLPLAGDAVNDFDAVTLRQLRNSSGGGGGPTMNGVMNYGIGEKTLWDSRASIPSFAVTADGQLLERAKYPELWAFAQLHSPLSESIWQSNINLRARYSDGDGSTTFRVPDLNGTQPGSIRGLYGRGDGAGFYQTGYVFENAVPNIIGSFNGGSTIGGSWLAPPNGSATGAFTVGPNGTLSKIVNASVTQVTAPSNIGFDASRYSDVYGRANTAEVRPNTFAGVWIIRASGSFQAANTTWTVLNGDSEAPPTGTWANGGSVKSAYTVNGEEQAACSMYVFTAKDSVGYNNAVLRLAVDNKQGNSFFISLRENGIISSSSGEFHTENLIRSNSNIVAGTAGAFVVPGVDNNEMRMDSAAAPSSGNFVNSIYGRHFQGVWQMGGVRGPSTALLRAQLNVNSGTGQNASYMFNTNGVGQAANWQSTSDERIKKNIKRIENPLETMKALKGVTWERLDNGNFGIGFVAQDVQKIFPGAVSIMEEAKITLKDGTKLNDVLTVDVTGVSAALHHEAILKLMKQNEEMRKELNELKAKLNK